MEESYVLLKCVKENSKLRIKMLSSTPFIKGYNCQFPRDIRFEGMYYLVNISGIKLLNNFYSMRKKEFIKLSTYNFDEVKKYVDHLNKSNIIYPKKIFGDDEDIKCIVCFENDKSIVYSPCGHYICCIECSNELNKCPLCRISILFKLNRMNLNNSE